MEGPFLVCCLGMNTSRKALFSVWIRVPHGVVTKRNDNVAHNIIFRLGTMNFLLIIRTGLATAFLIFALKFIADAINSWIDSPSVTSGTFEL